VWTLFVTEEGALSPRIQEGIEDAEREKALHKVIDAVTRDIEALQFNTAISRLMEFVNLAYKDDAPLDKDVMARFVLILSPFAPHIGEELWALLGNADTLAYEVWPEADLSLLVEDTVEIPVQVMGKMRGKITVPTNADEATVLAAAQADENVKLHLEGKQIMKTIFVPGKMVNLIAK